MIRGLPTRVGGHDSRAHRAAATPTTTSRDLKATAAPTHEADHPKGSKYAAYAQHSFVRICVGKGAEKTLEPQLLAVNGREKLNKLLGKRYGTDAELLAYMTRNKTTCALAIFESADAIIMPEYISDAIAQ